MMRKHAFNDALDDAIDAARGGTSADAVIDRYSHAGAELAPLLDVAQRLDRVPKDAPPSVRLHDNLNVVMAAVRDARGRAAEVERPAVRGAWWNRRLAFASMSLPAGVIALALAGGGGAAAATVAVSTGVDERVERAISRMAPGWAQPIVPGPAAKPDNAAGVEEQGTPTVAAQNPKATATPRPAASGPVEATAISAPGQAASTQASGTVSNLRGSVFDLLGADGSVSVQIDGKTAVYGELANGAQVQVVGKRSGNGRIHADVVAVTATAGAVDSPTSPAPGGPKTPVPSPHVPPLQADASKTAPGQSQNTKTPPGQAQQTKTPAGQAEKTKTPGPPATPPGEGGGNGGGGNGGNGGGSGNGNGNGNGGNNQGQNERP